MKQTRYRLFFAALAAVALLATSCSKESQGTGGITDGIYLSLSIDGAKAASSAQLDSRATAVDERAINDLWVLQFQMNAGSTTEGTLVAKSYFATVADPAKIKFKAKDGDNMALYVVANSDNSLLFSSTVDGTTLAVVKATSVNVTAAAGGNFPTDGSTNLPMVGRSTMVKLIHNATVPVTLTRTAAKVVLTIKNPLATTYPQLTVQSVQLKNVPKTYSMQVVNSASGFTGTTYYPAATADNFTNYTAVSGNISAAGTTSTYYLAPNVRGISTNTDERLKSDLTTRSGQGDFCTYVEILGTAKASATTPEVNVRYRLYLGGNNTNDFNIESNTAYNVGIELTGINGNDARMTIATDKFDLIQGGIDGDISGDIGGWFAPPTIGELKGGGIVYEVNGSKVKVLSLDQVELKWSAHNSYEIGIDGQNETDGEANSAAIKTYFANNTTTVGTDFSVAFPAVHFCDKMNTGGVTGWYLPANGELVAFYTVYKIAANQTAIDAGIANNSGTALSPGTLLWSSTESSSDPSNAWYVDFPHGNTNDIGKSSPVHVRCVREL